MKQKFVKLILSWKYNQLTKSMKDTTVILVIELLTDLTQILLQITNSSNYVTNS